jgi:hypothetical protein
MRRFGRQVKDWIWRWATPGRGLMSRLIGAPTGRRYKTRQFFVSFCVLFGGPAWPCPDPPQHRLQVG